MPPRPRPSILSLTRTRAPPPPPSTRLLSSRADAPPSSRWHGDLHARLGKCILFGLSHQQATKAGSVLRALADEWRALLAGSEGFLTGAGRGLEGQQVVWGEQDSFQHVNNVTYIRYAESARVNWATHFAVNAQNGGEEERSAWRELMSPRGTGLILKSIKCDFKFPMTYPDRVSVYHKLRHAPSAQSSSLLLDVVVLSHRHRRAAAKLEEDVVIYDYRKGQKTALPPFMREVLERTFQLQEEERARARARIWELVGVVEGLEKETWDREGAVEDLGSVGGKK